MLADSAEETLTLTMGDIHLQLPRTLLPASPPPLPPPLFSTPSGAGQPPSSSPPSSWGEVVNFSDSGFNFYPNIFDNSFPCHGVLNNERRFSSSSPTSNTSFLSETSFNVQPLLNNNQDSGIPSDNFGLLTTNCSPFRGNDSTGQDFPGTNLPCGGGSPPSSNDYLAVSRGLIIPPANFNFPNGNGFDDSGISSMGGANQTWDSPNTALSTPNNNNQFDFSFSNSDSSSNTGGGARRSSNGSNNSNASADSPTRIGPHGIQNYANQWNSGDVSSLLDNSPESSCSNSVITTSALGNTIWSPSQVSAANINNDPNNGSNCGSGSIINIQQWDATLGGFNKQQLLAFNQLLVKTHQEYIQNGDIGTAEQIQAGLLHVQQFIIKAFVSESGGLSDDSNGSPPMTGENSPLLPSPTEQSLERVAEMHRDMAGRVHPFHGAKDAPYTWSGQLPARIHRHPVIYSCKIFLGGLPYDITELGLVQAFKPFGNVKIEWPGKDGNSTKMKGFAYAIFESEKQVKLLLQSCTRDFSNSASGHYFYQVTTKRYRSKDVEIIPWAMSDSNFVRCQASKIDPLKTIFVGALHGMVNAEGLATIMNDLFGGVVYAGIDTDRQKYPIGSARVTFNNTRSYMKAVTACFVLIKTGRFDKKVQVDPYLEDATCTVCNLQQGPYFCRDRACFSYFCRTCFQQKHADGFFRTHRPMMRTASSKTGTQTGPIPKCYINSGLEQQLRYGYQHSHHHQHGNNMMNGGINHHHSNGNCDNYSHMNNNRNGWNNGHQRSQQWVNGGGGRSFSPRSFSPPGLVSPHHNHNNGNVHPPLLGLNSGGKLNNLSGEHFTFEVANQGAELGGHLGCTQGQYIPSYNNHRNIGHNGGYRRQQQHIMRWQ